MMLLLSLNLILLAFFILLNSLADFETDRARAVLASVNQAFHGEIEVAGQMPASRNSLGELPEVAAKLREVGSLFEAIAPMARAKSVRRANSVQVDFPASALFRPGSKRIRQDREAFLQRLAQSLRTTPDTTPSYLLEILVGVGSKRAGDGAATTGPANLEIGRAAVLAERLSAEGAGPDGLSTGLRPGAADSLRFVVLLRPDAGTGAAGGAGSGGGEG
jgi:hypothetical protein